MRDNFQTVLCDLDGTLVSTFRANFLAYQFATNKLKLNLTEDMFRATWGRDSRDFLPELFPDVKPETHSDIRDLKAKAYSNFLGETEINEPIMQLLSLFKESMQVGLVTTAKNVNVHLVLNHHGLTNFFDTVVSGDDVHRAKPWPDPYLVAMGRLSTTGGVTLAIEDSDAGVSSAEAAGIYCIRIRSYEGT